ncbi:MAG TPA: hypothetical protein PKE12_08355 [Kiritimatiellia bacterium]|nr:hypothetical protein [Kiritimatiellia bacterium]
MALITNNKLADLTPRWAEFRGFSLLFDNPGDSLAVRGALACLVADGDLAFYRGVREALQRIDLESLAVRHLFFPLAPRSYHVTACDGGNADNVEGVAEHYRDALRRFLRELPESVCADNPFAQLMNESTLVRKRDWGIRLAFDRLANWSGISIVACLKAADPDAAARLDAFASARRLLCGQLSAAFGIQPPACFVPHITLGYFANAERGQALGAPPASWQETFRERLDALVLSFDHMSLYGFTDMESFFARAKF